MLGLTRDYPWRQNTHYSHGLPVGNRRHTLCNNISIDLSQFMHVCVAKMDEISPFIYTIYQYTHKVPFTHALASEGYELNPTNELNPT